MVKIISDSTCDLSKDLLEKYDIDIAPLHIVLGEDEYEDGVNITPDEIYKWSDENKETPKTSAAGIEQTTEMMRPYVEAAIMAQEGKNAQEIADRIEHLKPLVRSSFVVDTLTYLHRGGRCTGLAAMAGGVLKLHPKIVVEDGKMRPDKKYRGKMERVVMDYAKDIEEDLKTAKKDRVFITHSGCSEDIIDEVKNYLQTLNIFDEILVTRAGGVISSHCGPGTLGVLYIKRYE